MAVDPAKYGIYDMKCSVEINKAGELQFLMTKSCSSYNLFSKERSVLTLIMDDATENDSKTIFRGVVKTIETDLFFQRTITANSDLIYLCDSVFEPHGDDIEEKPPARFKRIIEHHNIEMQGDPEKQIHVGNFTFSHGADKVEKYAKNGGYKDTMSQLQEDFKDFYGFYNIRYNSNYSKKWLDYTETTGKSTSQNIKFAVNILDYQYKDTVDDLFTILIPVGSDNLVLKNQNAKKKVKIRMPDQSEKSIDLYIVDKYIKIVDGIKKYGYIYQAESFTVDSNNIGSSGINKTIANSWSGHRKSGGGGGGDGDGYVYTQMTLLSGWNPSAMGLYVFKNGQYQKTTDTYPVPGRYYYKKSGINVPSSSGGGSGGGDGSYRYDWVNVNPPANPKAMGLYERKAFTIDTYIRTNDTTVLGGKTYYRRVAV